MTDPRDTPDRMLADVATYLARARWFGGKGREFEVERIDPLALGLRLVHVAYADGDREVYQLPLSSYDEPQERLAHALVGEWDGAFHYDGAHDRELTSQWLEAFAEERTVAGQSGGPTLHFHRLPGHELDLSTHSTVFSGEQSNSSLAYGEDSLLKLFRKVTPGENPDIEIHRALTEAGSTHVAHLYGWLSADGDADAEGDGLRLGMLQQFLRTATDGWELALSSLRILFSEADLHADEAGGDFASEASLLGTALAEVHEAMRAAFPTGTLAVADLAATMSDRLRAQTDVVPGLAAYRPALEARFEGLTDFAAEAPTQRVHGDLHLGQTLRTTLGWKLVDFEGEPAKPLAERRRPDSPWRDVAGMLRSFDYAARTLARDMRTSPEESAQIAYRAREWVGRARTSFLAGYAAATAPLTDPDLALVEAYELDKAVYEAGYEARNRPDWLEIPLAALARVEED